MNDFASLIRRLQRRMRWVYGMRYLVLGLAIGTSSFAGMILAGRLVYPPLPLDLSAGVIAVASLLAGLLLTLLAPVTPQRVCLRADRQLGLAERLSSALAAEEEKSRMATIVREDALTYARKLDANKVFPLRLRRESTILGLAFLFVCAFYFLVPQKDLWGWGEKDQQRREKAVIQKQVAQEMQQQIKTFQKQLPQFQENPELKALLHDMEKMIQEMQPHEDQRQEVAKLTEFMDRLQMEKEKLLQEGKGAQQTLAKNMETQNLEKTQALAEALEEGDLSKAAQEMEKARQELEKLLNRKKQLKKKLKPEEQRALEQWKKEVEQLRQSLNSNTKLGEELRKTLDELDRLLAESPQLDQMTAAEEEKFLQDLQKTLEQMQNLEEYLKNLQQMTERIKAMDQMYQSLAEARKQLANGKPCPTCQKLYCGICERPRCEHDPPGCPGHASQFFPPGTDQGQGQSGNGQGQQGNGDLPVGLPNSSGQGQQSQGGQSAGQQGMGSGNQGVNTGQSSGNRGQGGGTPPIGPEGNAGWTPMRLKGEQFQGKIIAQFKVRGDSPVGEAKAGYEEYASEMIKEAETSLSKEKIPQGYQEYVRQYFDSVNPGKK